MLGGGLVFMVFRLRVGLGFGALGQGVGPEPNKVWSGFRLWVWRVFRSFSLNLVAFRCAGSSITLDSYYCTCYCKGTGPKPYPTV